MYHPQKRLAQWADPIVEALDALEAEDELCEVRLTRPRTPAIEKARDVEVRAVIAYVGSVLIFNQIERDAARSPPVFSDDESGSDKATSGDELGTDDD
jgi:hypothetical protein